MYYPIDLKRTGEKLQIMLKLAGYDVKYVQEYLHLACPQSIYRWFKGKALPSVEHLCALANLLCVHMEELLVLQIIDLPIYEYTDVFVNTFKRNGRLSVYARVIYTVA